MLSILAGPVLSANPGQEIEVPDSQADQLISGGFAIPVKSVVIETAVLASTEDTSIPEVKKGKGRR